MSAKLYLIIKFKYGEAYHELLANKKELRIKIYLVDGEAAFRRNSLGCKKRRVSGGKHEGESDSLRFPPEVVDWLVKEKEFALK